VRAGQATGEGQANTRPCVQGSSQAQEGCGSGRLAKAGTVCQTGMLQEAAFGSELSLMAPGDLNKLRVAAVRAHGLQSMGLSHRVWLLARPLDRGPRWNIDCRIIGAFSREAWNMVHAPHLDHLTPVEFAGLFSLPEQPTVPYAAAWKDPVSTLRHTMAGMHLHWKRPMIWEYNGMEMHLQAGTPALLPRLFRAGARQTQLEEAAFPGAPEGWSAPYLHSLSLQAQEVKTAWGGPWQGIQPPPCELVIRLFP
jgi:hypothetical protein